MHVGNLYSRICPYVLFIQEQNDGIHCKIHMGLTDMLITGKNQNRTENNISVRRVLQRLSGATGSPSQG